MKFLLGLSLIAFSFSLKVQQIHQVSIAEFCWRDTYGRGVGKIPDNCGDKQKLGALCYEKCPEGMKRSGLDCHSKCPSQQGWEDQGLLCRLAQYGRGDGYEWKASDGFSSKGMRKRCEKDHGKGKCQKWGAVYYKKCKQGYDNVLCCLCRPQKNPKCEDYNMKNSIVSLSCQKKIQIGKPSSLSCDKDEDNDGGLCYKECKNNYKGVGPICWGQSPSGWVNCGMGSAKSKLICSQMGIAQFTSVAQLAATIAVQPTLSLTAKSKMKQLKEQFKANKQLYEKVQNLLSGVNTAQSIQTLTQIKWFIQDDAQKMTDADVIRLYAQLSGWMDVTGISPVIASYSYPTCDKI